jgi:DNA-binding HxlR family transcriptional regulator
VTWTGAATRKLVCRDHVDLGGACRLHSVYDEQLREAGHPSEHPGIAHNRHVNAVVTPRFATGAIASSSLAVGRNMDSRRIYRHFCMMARALEVVGERWSLPIVRDLLLGPRRFTDLARSLTEITPTRLTKRLRQLEAAGILTRDPPTTGREVWYQLTEAGSDLGPVVEALTLWGIDHALEPPHTDEAVHPTAVMIGTKVFLDGRPGRLRRPVAWVWRFPGDSYTLRSDEDGWRLARGDAEAPDLVVETTLEAWARFLAARGARRLPRDDIRLVGKAAAIKEFAKAFAAELRSG